MTNWTALGEIKIIPARPNFDYGLPYTNNVPEVQKTESGSATMNEAAMDEQSLADAGWFREVYHVYTICMTGATKRIQIIISPIILRGVPRFYFEKIFKPREETLGKLDPKAWEQLIEKTLDSVTKKCLRREYAQLFDYLNEARGDALLVDSWIW